MSHPQQMFNQALQLHQAGRVHEAIDLYAKVLPHDPTNAQLLFLVGTATLQVGQHQLGIDLLNQSIMHDPKNPSAHFNQGNAFQETSRWEEAVAAYDQALALRPDDAETHFNRGNALLSLNRREEALVSYAQAVALNPDHAEAHNNRGIALRDLNRLEEAVASYDQALAARPDYAEAYNNRGNALRMIERLDDALASYNQALAIKPNHADAHANRGNVLQDLQRLEEAQESYDRALALNPDHGEVYWNKALLLLLTGQYLKGWELYEWRLKTTKDKPHIFPQPAWRGQASVRGKRILVYCEQGLGDVVQFCRYLPQLGALSAEIIFEAPKPLIPLISTLDCPLTIVAKGEALPAFDAHCPVMSLPHAFETTLETVPADTPYLYSDKDKVQQWQQRLGATDRLRVGLACSGSTSHKYDARRNIRLQDLLPAIELPMEWHSLHKEYRRHDLEFLGQHPEIHQHQDELHDFSDTAALIECMDLVISVDTSVAHVAGAMGKPVWILLPYAPDYRWMLDRHDSPWYPTARLFRQSMIGDWQSVIAKVASALQASPLG